MRHFMLFCLLGAFGFAAASLATDRRASMFMSEIMPAAGVEESIEVAENEAAADVGAVVSDRDDSAQDSCGDHSALIGQNINDVDISAIEGPEQVRVLNPDLAGTMDYIATRLTIYADENGIITQAGCN